MSDRKFKDYSLGARIRLQIGNTISPFATQEQIFSSPELHNLLVQVFKFKQYEVSYELLKILFFGKNKYKSLKIDQLINYITEKHLGENTITAYSRENPYLCQNDKLMTKSEFINTINFGLEFISNRNKQKDEEQFTLVFEQIDTNKSGTISQEQYLTFLKEYFGSQSPMAKNHFNIKNVISQELISSKRYDQKQKDRDSISASNLLGIQLFQSNQALSPLIKSRYQPGDSLQELKDLITSQITQKCLQYSKTNYGTLTRAQTYQFLYNILGLQSHSIQFILSNYFDFVSFSEVNMNELVEVISQVNFRQIFSSQMKQQFKIQQPKDCIFDVILFKKKMLENCFFFNKKPSGQLLQSVFRQLQKKSQLKQLGYISLEDIRSYALTFLCNNRLIFRKSNAKKTYTMLMSVPISIAQVQNSHLEDSDCNQVRPRQFSSSLCEPYDEEKILNGKHQNFINTSQRNNLIDIRPDQESSRSLPTIEISTQKTTGKHEEKQNMYQTVIQDLAFSSVPRKRNSLQPSQEPSTLKQKLWFNMRKILNSYHVKSKESISLHEITTIFQNEPSFKSIPQKVKDKINNFYEKRSQMSQNKMINFIIFAVGQSSLVNYNKTQIKGKFILQQSQIVNILFESYRLLADANLNIFKEFLSKLIQKQNKKQLNYRFLLQVVGRELTQNIQE